MARARDAGGIMLPLSDAHRLHQALYPSFVTLPSTIDRDLFIHTYQYPGATARAIRTVEYLVDFLNIPSTKRKSTADFLAYARRNVDEDWDGLQQEDEVGTMHFFGSSVPLVTKPHTVLTYMEDFT